MFQSEALKIISNAVNQCTLCSEFVEYRKLTNGIPAPGEGNPNADLMILGEALGKVESESGRPFVGKAGQLLDKIIKAAGWERKDIFITNICRCRPPNNRIPTIEEVQNCRKFLDMQIKITNPRWIICLGKTASTNLLGYSENMSIQNLRGVHDWNGRKVIATFHPSFLLREEWAKAELWLDIQPAIEALKQ